ncbi:MAG TPA: hypothetical protein VFW66_09585 [Gemmatimonadales bacterium]|nr:hypothetical protein [Gemmatimonadales bacterium]
MRRTLTTTSALAVLATLTACGAGGKLAQGPSELAAGTRVTAKLDDEIHSRHNKAGESVTATVSSAVKDEHGQVVIPEGATLTLRIEAIHESEHKGDPGVLRLSTQQLAADGHTYPLTASVVSVERQLAGRKTNVNDAAKVGVGVGAGALAGGLVAGGKGAVVGGVLGGAVGTQRAIQTKDRDVYVAKGSRIVIALKQKLLAER